MATTAAPGQREHLSTGDALRLEGVSRSFGALKAVEDVSFSVAAGERRAVIGANGAGKTTLFNVITGDYAASAGRVRFFGEDVTTHPPYERIRAGMRRTYQSSLLFRDLTVRDNLFLAVRGVSRGRFSFMRPGRSNPSRAAAEDLLERVRLTQVGDEPVALAHIDGDWYNSVKVCLDRIAPRLVPGGVLVIDDYDAWSGCRKAVDEWFAGKDDRFEFVRRERLHIERRQ